MTDFRRDSIRLPQAFFSSESGRSLFGLSQERDFKIEKSFGVYRLTWNIPKGLDAFHIKILMAILSNVTAVSSPNDRVKVIEADPTDSKYTNSNLVWHRLQTSAATYFGSLRQLLIAAGLSATNPENYAKLRQFLLHERVDNDGNIRSDNALTVSITGGGIKASSPSAILASAIHDDETVTVQLNWLLTAAIFESFDGIESKDQRAILKYVVVPSAKLQSIMGRNEMAAAVYLWLAYYTKGWTISVQIPTSQLEILVWGGGKRSGKARLKNISRIQDCLPTIVPGEYGLSGLGQKSILSIEPLSNKLIQAPATNSGPETQNFDRFWTVYPACQRKTSAQKKRCSDIWTWMKLDEEIEHITKDLRIRMEKSERGNSTWQAAGGKFIHNPSTYLTEKMWIESLPTKVKNTVTQPVSGESAQLNWWSQAGFTSAIEAENDGCHEGKQHFFMNGVRIKDVYGNPRPKSEVFDDLVRRMNRWMMNFTNEAFSLERDHALRMMRKMPRIDFWSMLKRKMPEKNLSELRQLLLTLPHESETRRVLELSDGV